MRGGMPWFSWTICPGNTLHWGSAVTAVEAGFQFFLSRSTDVQQDHDHYRGYSAAHHVPDQEDPSKEGRIMATVFENYDAARTALGAQGPDGIWNQGMRQIYGPCAGMRG